MTHQIKLPSWHYAHGWPELEELRPAAEITELGIRFIETPEGLEKEQLSMELLRVFHVYLYKYLDMICRGHLPRYGNGINKDAREFLQLLVPKGTPVNRNTLSFACKHLHLAFKGHEPVEIYNVLATVLLKVIHKYDPNYVQKVRQAVAVINRSRTPHFTVFQINERLTFDARFIIRMLEKKGFVEKVEDTSDPRAKKKYRKVEDNWPPPQSLFESGPIGLAYHVAKRFRYALKQYIVHEMEQIEAKEELLQLEHRYTGAWNYSDPGSEMDIHEKPLYSPESDYRDRTGKPWAADTNLSKAQFDISRMTLEWVQETQDHLFADLAPSERMLLRLVYACEMPWKDIGATFGITSKAAKEMHEEILAGIRQQAKAY
jgi:hypothetical protein